jgi:tRNA(fMet)-specific endonuclease VapC
MTARYLVDTDWAIHWLRGETKVTDRLAALRPQGLALSVISLAELYEGIYGSRDPRQAEAGLRDFLNGVEILSVGEATCQIFGRERSRLRAARRIIGDF